LRAWTGSHIAPKRGKVEDVLSAGTIEEEDDKLKQAVINIALTSPKRLVGAASSHYIKAGTSRNAVWALNQDRALHRG